MTLRETQQQTGASTDTMNIQDAERSLIHLSTVLRYFYFYSTTFSLTSLNTSYFLFLKLVVVIVED